MNSKNTSLFDLPFTSNECYAPNITSQFQAFLGQDLFDKTISNDVKKQFDRLILGIID